MRSLTVVSLLVLALLTSTGAHSTVRAQSPAVVTASRVLVVPFEEARPDRRAYWLREGSAVILTDSFLAMGLPAMRRGERVRSFELLSVPVGPALSHATVLRVAQVVGASHVVTGTVSLNGDQIAVRARATLLDTAKMGPEISESGPLADIFAIYDRLAVRLVPGGNATPEQLENSHPPIAAFEQFIKGLVAESPTTKLAFLTEALRLSPTLQRARLAAWDVHNEIGEHDRALDVVRQVPSGHRLHRQARFAGTLSLIELKRYQEAFDELTRLNDEDSDAVLLNNLGIVQLRRQAAGGYRATTYFNEAVGLDGGESLFNLGYAYWLDGDGSAAVHWLREAVRRNPADHAAHYVLGVALAATGNPTEGARERALATQLSSSYADWEATSPSASVPRGLERIRTELDVSELSSIENVIGAAGQRDQQQLAAFHLEAARRAFEAERDGEVIAALRRAVYLAPYDHDAHLLLGRTYLRGGRLTEARDAFKISLWSQDTVEGRLQLASVYEKMGMTTEATAELRAALRLDPSNADARQRLNRVGGRE